MPSASRPGKLPRPRPGRKNDVVRLDRLRPGLGLNLDNARPCQGPLAVEDGDLVFLEEMGDASGELACNLARALDHGADVVGKFLGGKAEVLQMMHHVEHFARAQQGLGRDAAPVQADAAEMLALDQGDLHLELGRADGSHIAARSAADNDQIELMLCHRGRPCLT